jgi:hypothetical protein
MIHNYTNLLPRSKVRALRREYFVRFACVAGWLTLFLLAAHAVLLIPTYQYSMQNSAAKQAELDALVASQTTAEEAALAERLSSLRADAIHLERLAVLPTASARMGALLALPRGGISLTGITFSREEEGMPLTMSVSGQAGTRDALRAYVSALETMPGVTKANLPISAYAKERDIPFTITLELQS